MDDPVILPALPVPLRWLSTPADGRVDGPDALTLTAGPRTDLFTDPGGPDRFANAPALLGDVDGDFTLSARVSVALAETYDAGVLLLYQDADTWAKLCLELSPQGRPTVVSVVTRGRSDDANGWTVDSGEIRLRISRIGDAYAFHASTDGDVWQLARYFTLGGAARVGFLAQSPLGPGSTVRFTGVEYARRTLSDLRGGG